jgi:hypothetical protein
VNILNLAASDAPDMQMVGNRAVISGFPAPEFQLLDNAKLVQHLQIAIDRPQAYFGELIPHDRVQHRCGRVRFQLLQLFENHLPLLSVSLEHWFKL